MVYYTINTVVCKLIFEYFAMVGVHYDNMLNCMAQNTGAQNASDAHIIGSVYIIGRNYFLRERIFSAAQPKAEASAPRHSAKFGTMATLVLGIVEADDVPPLDI